MPILDKARRIEVPKGAKTAEAVIDADDGILDGVMSAAHAFIAEHGHMPDESRLTYIIATSDGSTVVEIIEYPED